MAATHDPLAPAAANTATESANELKDTLKHKVTDATSHLRNTANDFGRSAKEHIDRNLKSAAGAMENTASKLRKAPNTGGRLGSMAHTTADKLEAGAQYFRDHDSQDMFREVGNYTRKQPAVALGIAAAVGFLIGMSLQRDRRY